MILWFSNKLNNYYNIHFVENHTGTTKLFKNNNYLMLPVNAVFFSLLLCRKNTQGSKKQSSRTNYFKYNNNIYFKEELQVTTFLRRKF